MVNKSSCGDIICTYCHQCFNNHTKDCPFYILGEKLKLIDADYFEGFDNLEGGNMSENKCCKCPYCDVNSLGEHEANCPFHPNNTKNETCRAQFGWMCPRCGTIYAPFVTECHCAVYEKNKVTCCGS